MQDRPSAPTAEKVVGGYTSSVLAIYGCIVSVILSHSITNDTMTEAQGYRNLSAGLAVGLSCLASGLGMARLVHGYMKQEHARSAAPSRSNNGNDGLQEGLISTNLNRPIVPTWRLLICLIFLEAIGLYGLVVALFLSSNQ